MKQFLKKLWKDERGAEVVEWIIIVALIAAVALFIVNTGLKNSLQNGGTTIVNAVNASLK